MEEMFGFLQIGFILLFIHFSNDKWFDICFIIYAAKCTFTQNENLFYAMYKPGY